jgi:hypothetical protein
MLSRSGSGTLKSPSAGASAGASSAGEAIEDDDDDDDDDDDVLLSDSESGVSELSVASESVICIWSEV